MTQTQKPIGGLVPFAGKGAHFNWARRNHVAGAVTVLVVVRRVVEAMTITPQADGSFEGQFVPCEYAIEWARR